jgi:NAD(P)H-hydrate repair Nnr-like enzyme with NAD(P)H-hydrate dehydratase domain
VTAAESGAVAAHLHGRTGQLAAQRGPLLAGDLVRRLPEAVGRVHGIRPDRLGDSAA